MQKTLLKRAVLHTEGTNEQGSIAEGAIAEGSSVASYTALFVIAFLTVSS